MFKLILGFIFLANNLMKMMDKKYEKLRRKMI